MERMSKVEFKEWLESRLVDFSVAVFRFLDALPKKCSTQVIAYQLGKSASSVGANYSEANRAESRDDFVHKIQIAMKEAAESSYWLQILVKLYPMHAVVSKLLDESIELRNLPQSISHSAQRNAKQSRQLQNLGRDGLRPVRGRDRARPSHVGTEVLQLPQSSK